MKKKPLLIGIAIVILLILAFSGIYYMLEIMEKFQTENDETYYGNMIRMLEAKPTQEEMEARKKQIDEMIATQEDIIENVAIEDDYAPIILVTEEGSKIYYLGYQQELNISMLVEAVGLLIHKEIQVNEIRIGDQNSIKIDFSKEGAPVNQEVYVESEFSKYIIEDNTKAAKCIFDSIKETIQANLGEGKNIYYSVDGKDINIEGLEIIKTSHPY